MTDIKKIEELRGRVAELEITIQARDKLVRDLRAKNERLKRYECSWTDCGAKKKNKDLQVEVSRYREGIMKLWELSSYHHPDCAWWVWDHSYSWSITDCTCPEPPTSED